MPPSADTIDMNAGFKTFWPGTSTLQTAPLGVSLAAVALVFLIFVGDWITPAPIIVGLAYEAPVVLAGLKGTPLLTIQVTVLGMLGLILGWFMDLAADSFHFSSERIENRVLSVISLLIVSWLTLRAQRNSATLPSR